MFILLGRTSEINLPKNNYAPVDYTQCTFYFRCLGGSRSAGGGGIPRCRVGSLSGDGSPNALQVTQEEGHTGFLRLPSAALALIFLARRIQPFLSLVDREVEFCLWSQRIFPSLPGSRLTIFLSRCKFSTLTTRQPMVEFYLLTFPRFPLRKKEHKSYFGKNRTHDFRTSRCAAYLLDHSGDK